MRFLVTLVLSGSLIVGCGEDGSDNPRSTCLTTGPVNPGGSPPEMTNIAWDPLGFCQQGAFNNYNVFVFASDSDSPLLELTFDVNVPGCSPVAHLGNVFVVGCPNSGPVSGVACAEDPDGNTSSRAEFTFQPCIPGDCNMPPDSCDLLAPDPSAR